MPLILAGCAALLAIAIAAELTTGTDETGTDLGTAAPRLPPSVMRVERTTVEGHRDFAAAILARPLFATSRRPPAATATTARANPSSDTSMPRLAGIIMEGPTRVAIFQPSRSGKPIVAHEGEEVDGRKIVVIAPFEVTVSGPQGEEHLWPIPDVALLRSPLPLVEAPPANPDMKAMGRGTAERLRRHTAERSPK